MRAVLKHTGGPLAFPPSARVCKPALLRPHWADEPRQLLTAILSSAVGLRGLARRTVHAFFARIWLHGMGAVQVYWIRNY